MMVLSELRRRQNVLVPEAHALGAIAVIRSLGRAGYIVHACSSQPDALGLKSNFATHAVVCPNYEDADFEAWLKDYVVTHEITGIVPSEGFLHAVEGVFEDYRHLMPVPADKQTAYAAFSKIDVLETLLSVPEWHDHLPPSLVVRSGQKVPSIDEIAALGSPFFLKGDARDHRFGSESLIVRLETAEEAHVAVLDALEKYDAVLLQGWVGGVKAAMSFCLTDKEKQPICESGVVGDRTTPHQGGMMTYRRSWRHETMRDIGLEWLHRIGWHGVAMVECKWDPATDQFWLIEINARYWGYLHLDWYSGVDMPRIQMDRFFNIAKFVPQRQMLGIRCRHTFPGDSSHLISLVKDPDIGIGKKIVSTARFVLDFLDPSLHSDLLFPGDRKLYWHQLWQFIGLIAGRARAKVLGSSEVHPTSKNGVSSEPRQHRQMAAN